MKSAIFLLFLGVVVHKMAEADKAGVTINNPQECVNASQFPDNYDFFPDKVQPEESLLWDIQYFNTYKIIRNEFVDKTYVLYQCGTEPPNVNASEHAEIIPVPLQDGAALTSTTTIPHFELLGIRLQIRGWIGSTSFISSPCLNKLIADDQVAILSNASDPAEVSAFLNKTGQGVVAFDNGFFDGITNVDVHAFREAENVAVYEWNKYIAAFFNLEALANHLFEESTARYAAVTDEAASLTANIATKPTLVWAYYANFSGMEGFDVARCPNYYCEFAEHCSANILSSREGSVSFFGRQIMNITEFVAFAKDADYWIFPAGNWDSIYEFYKDELDTFVSVQNKKVYDTLGDGPNSWFEQRLVEYDIVLEDFCAVVETTGQAHTRKWFRDVFTECLPEEATCADVNAPLVTEVKPRTCPTKSLAPVKYGFTVLIVLATFATVWMW